MLSHASKQLGVDAGKVYRLLEQAMQRLPDIPVILRRANCSPSRSGNGEQWFASAAMF